MGVMQIKRQTFFARVQGNFLAVPDFPLWVCLVCGYEEYDVDTLMWLQDIFDPREPRRGLEKQVEPGESMIYHHPISFYSVN